MSLSDRERARYERLRNLDPVPPSPEQRPRILTYTLIVVCLLWVVHWWHKPGSARQVKALLDATSQTLQELKALPGKNLRP